MPIERFKDQYANWRYNPFTGADMAVDKTEDNIYIPTSSPFVIQLLELPRKNTPSSVSVYCYDDPGYFTEVETTPTQGQFRVDYPPEDGEGTGLIEFNQNDANKKVRIEYKATGSPIVSEFLDTKVSYPAGAPADHQILGFVSGAPEWRYNPIRYSHEDSIIYHASGENESCLLFRFKKSSKEGTVILELKGAKIHQGYYTELKSHNHGAGTLAADEAGVHSHLKGSLAGSQPAHTHGISGLTGNQDTNHNHAISGRSHRHASNAGEGPLWTEFADGCSSPTGNQSASHKHSTGTLAIGSGGNDVVTISGNVASSGAHVHTISGSTGNAGGWLTYAYPHSLKIYINGVDKTSQVLAKTGLTQFGDGSPSHAFVTTGSGEMDVTDLITSDGFHEIKITEPTSASGGRCLLHLELY